MPNTKVVGIIFPYILTPIPNLYDHSFPRYGQITFLTFRRPTTLTFDLKFWKYLSVTVYPYVICMPSFIMISWEMAEILHFEILRKHGQTNTQTHTQTHKWKPLRERDYFSKFQVQTWRWWRNEQSLLSDTIIDLDYNISRSKVKDTVNLVQMHQMKSVHWVEYYIW